jgi:hypothetical protein
MDDLVTWLRAQLDEDERELDGSRWDDSNWALPGWLDRPRLKAEFDAKRALIEETIRPFLGIGETTMSRVAWVSLRLLALPYADQPGYREEWRPS